MNEASMSYIVFYGHTVIYVKTLMPGPEKVDIHLEIQVLSLRPPR